MQQKKEKDNPGLIRQNLAKIVAHSFNRRAHTGRKIVQCKRLWVKNRVIPRTTDETNKHIFPQMEDEDLVLSGKKKTGESKINYYS